MNSFVIKALEIDRVRAVNGDLTVVDVPGDGINESEIFVLVIAAEGGRKQNQRHAATVAEGEHLKLAAQVRRVPFNVTFVHLVPAIRANSKAKSRNLSLQRVNSNQEKQ